MKKIICLILIIFVAAGAAQAQKLGRDFLVGGTDEKYQVYRDYFNDYHKQLNEAFQPKGKFPKRIRLITEAEYYIYKDGTISDFLEVDSSDIWLHEWSIYRYHNLHDKPLQRHNVKKYYKKFDEYVMNTIINNPPKPFPKEMEYDYIEIETSLGYSMYKQDLEGFLDIMNNRIDFVNIKGIYYPPKFSIDIVKKSK